VVPAALTTGRTIRFYDEFFGKPRPKVGVVHELAHVWDAGTWASESIESFAGKEKEQPPTLYAETNPEEHWAETVASWVYPDYPARERRELGPLHQQYMALAVSGQIPIPWAEPPALDIPPGTVLP